MKMAADGDVRLDVEHHHMLAVGDGAEGELRAGVWVAGGVDHHIDEARARQRLGVGGNGDQAFCDGGVDCGGAVRIDRALLGKSGERGGGLSLGRAHLGHGAEPQPRHAVQLHHDVGAHLAAAGKADGHGSARLFAGLEFGNEGGDACDHAFFVTFFLAARRLGTSRRTGPVTESASPFFNSPGCLP